MEDGNYKLNYNQKHFRYDQLFVLEELVQQGRIMPQVVSNGVKIFKMTVRGTTSSPKTIFLDTFNFLPLALGMILF